MEPIKTFYYGASKMHGYYASCTAISLYDNPRNPVPATYFAIPSGAELFEAVFFGIQAKTPDDAADIYAAGCEDGSSELETDGEVVESVVFEDGTRPRDYVLRY